MRELVSSGGVDYVPISLAEVPRLLDSGRLAFDVALVQASPPNCDGMCSLGVSVDVTRAAVRSARSVIAEINPHMPRTGPESEVPFDRFDQVVAVDGPVIEYLHEPLGLGAERDAPLPHAHSPPSGPFLERITAMLPSRVISDLDYKHSLLQLKAFNRFVV